MPIAPDGSPLPYNDSPVSFTWANQVGSDQSGGGQPGIDAPEYPDIIALLEKILAEEPDPQDSAELSKLIAGLYKLAASRVKEQDDAMAGKLSPRLMRRNG